MSDETASKEAEAYAVSVGLLARREHSARELAAKLRSRGFVAEVIEPVLERLATERLQSDERFVEAYLRQRSEKGYGPQRIAAELGERGIDDSLISAGFRQAEAEGEIDWFARAEAVYARKFGGRPIEDIKERAKRMRFMQYRGFTHEQIAAAVNSNE
ncbi:regulatory protein RecX [Guyparkeria sp.]|uniref:regulatory protein RecX n=1 Tax=Guyparkeria sp. TaxID=2035736 RepID=UPI0039704B79